MLKTLSGERHDVYTAVCLSCKNINFNETVLQKTGVWFRCLEDEETEEYLKTASFFDKAGSYGIQEDGKYFVKKICGDYSNVVGLPIFATIKLLEKYAARIK
jgi:septum formation protein